MDELWVIVNKLNKEYFGGLINIRKVGILEVFKDKPKVCAQYWKGDGFGEIYVLKRYLDSTNYVKLEETIFHEMVHQVVFSHGSLFHEMMECY